MSAMTEWLDRTLYPGFQSNWGDQVFRAEILKHAGRNDRLLDLGAGAGVVKDMSFHEHVARVCGVDLDDRVLDNPNLDEARVCSAVCLPYADDEFDLVFANNVLEHLDDVDAVFREVARVLKPGGLFLAKTPNRRHYVAAIAAWTPHWFHRVVNAWRGRRSVDTFPTFYRANTPRAIRRAADRAQFESAQFVFLEGRPEYLRMTTATYLAGWAYERFVNRTPGASMFSAAIIAVLRKASVRANHPRQESAA